MESALITTGENALSNTHDIGMNEAFQEFCGGLRLSKRTEHAYYMGVKRFILWCAEQGINRPKRTDYKAYLDGLSLTLRPTSINAYMVAVRRFYQFMEVNYHWENITKYLKGEKIERGNLKDPLTADGAKALLKVPNRLTKQGRRDYALLVLLLTCGLRTIEISRANWCDFGWYLGRRVLYVQGKGKADKRAFVIVPEQAASALNDYKEDIKPESESPLFQSMSHNSEGERLTTRSVSRIVKQYLKDAGFDSERLTAHSLRHTAVTLALLNGQTIQEAQAFARHANITTTTVYAHNLEAVNNKCAQTVADAVFGDN